MHYLNVCQHVSRGPVFSLEVLQFAFQAFQPELQFVLEAKHVQSADITSGVFDLVSFSHTTVDNQDGLVEPHSVNSSQKGGLFPLPCSPEVPLQPGNSHDFYEVWKSGTPHRWAVRQLDKTTSTSPRVSCTSPAPPESFASSPVEELHRHSSGLNWTEEGIWTLSFCKLDIPLPLCPNISSNSSCRSCGCTTAEQGP